MVCIIFDAHVEIKRLRRNDCGKVKVWVDVAIFIDSKFTGTIMSISIYNTGLWQAKLFSFFHSYAIICGQQNLDQTAQARSLIKVFVVRLHKQCILYMCNLRMGNIGAWNIHRKRSHRKKKVT